MIYLPTWWSIPDFDFMIAHPVRWTVHTLRFYALILFFVAVAFLTATGAYAILFR